MVYVLLAIIEGRFITSLRHLFTIRRQCLICFAWDIFARHLRLAFSCYATFDRRRLTTLRSPFIFAHDIYQSLSTPCYCFWCTFRTRAIRQLLDFMRRRYRCASRSLKVPGHRRPIAPLPPISGYLLQNVKWYFSMMIMHNAHSDGISPLLFRAMAAS